MKDFKTAIRMMLRNAVMSQNLCQFHVSGNILPIAPNPPSDLAPSAEKMYFISPTYPESTLHPYLMPAGKLSKNPYSMCVTLSAGNCGIYPNFKSSLSTPLRVSLHVCSPAWRARVTVTVSALRLS